MAIPQWSTCRIYGTWTDAEGNRLPGKVQTTISARVTCTPADLIIPAGKYKPGCVDLNTTDTGKAALDFAAPATDDPDIPETGWGVTIVVTFSDAQIAAERYVLASLPSGGEVDLRTYIPTNATNALGTPSIGLGVAGGVALLNSDGVPITADGTPITAATGTSSGSTGDTVTLTADQLTIN